MSALDDWKAKAVHEVTLESGTTVGLRLPNIPACIRAGGIPMAVVNKLTKVTKGAEASDPTDEDLEHDARFQAEMVRAAVATFDGEPIELSLADVGELPEEDRAEIFTYASRAKALPKAG